MALEKKYNDRHLHTSLQPIVRENMERLVNDYDVFLPSSKRVTDHSLDVAGTEQKIWIDLKHTHVHARFNPSDINQCDEELVLLYRNGGMVGISMDQRIPGVDNDEHKREIKKRLRSLRDRKTGKRIPWRRVWHLVLFVDNLVHILKVLFEEIRTNGIPSHGLAPWDVICIGSDFNRIINLLDTYPTKGYFADFEKELNMYFREYADKKDMRLIGNPDVSTIKMILKKVFYSNLERFVKEYFPV